MAEFGNQPDQNQQFFENAVRVQKDFPDINADQEISPERNDDQEKKNIFGACAHAGKLVADRICNRNADRGGNHAEPQGTPDDRGVTGITQVLNCLHGPAGTDAAKSAEFPFSGALSFRSFAFEIQGALQYHRACPFSIRKTGLSEKKPFRCDPGRRISLLLRTFCKLS